MFRAQNRAQKSNALLIFGPKEAARTRQRSRRWYPQLQELDEGKRRKRDVQRSAKRSCEWVNRPERRRRLAMPDILFILLLALVLLGPKKLPHVAATFGRYLAQFQRMRRELLDQINAEVARMEASQAQLTAAPVPALRPALTIPTRVGCFVGILRDALPSKRLGIRDLGTCDPRPSKQDI